MPETPIVLSCAHNERELSKLTRLTERLAFEPHRVFAGSLGLLELVTILSMSRLHLGGDSGGLHVAVMAGAPTVSWFRNYEGAREWAPIGPQHRTLFGETSPCGILGIDAESVIRAAKAVLE
jgi:ADP-heptose:LPS heptosyltransferase